LPSREAVAALPAVGAASAVAAVGAREAVAAAAARLAQARCETPRLDAELLVALALGVDRVRLVTDPDAPVPLDRLEVLLARREAREPVAYIVGVREFRRLSVHVDRRVLIPRPETELLVEVGLALRSGASVVDVGCGSGAVALALKDERPDLVVTGTDVSADALSVARGNADRLGLDVRLVEADLLDGSVYDAVLANLPYVLSGFPLPPEVGRYEPAVALFGGGADGLDVVRRLVDRLAGVDLIGLEVGFDQAAAVASLVAAAGYGSVETLRDLAGIERVVVGRR
jgi:release factor glutamine methyltransferase